MARPQKVGLDYFPHDTNASNDMKMQALLTFGGLAGLGFYWFLIERMYNEDTFLLDISASETIQIHCRNMSITTQEWDRYLEICLKYGLFKKDIYDTEKKLCSDGVMKRASIVVEKRKESQKRYEEAKAERISKAEKRQKKASN